jgi:hypothetical protein
MNIKEKREFPMWAKALVAGVFGAGGAGASMVPINYNAEAGYLAVQEAYPTATIETRSWRPYIHRVNDGGMLVIVETSMIDGSITDRW